MPSVPPIRACLFDMDGLLLDTEDLYTKCTNEILAAHNRPALPWSIKAKLQGRPGPESVRIFHDWAQLPLTQEEYVAQLAVLQRQYFPSAAPLPGVKKLLADLSSTDARTTTGKPVHIGLATSSHAGNFALKTAHLQELFAVFADGRRVLGDDPRVGRGRGKPLPDIYLLALKTINESLGEGEEPITPQECLVFEDSVPGVEAGRRAGMQVVWVPHEKLKEHYAGREDEILAGRMGEADQEKGRNEGDESGHLGQIGDGMGRYLLSLEGFPYRDYGIVVPE